MQLAMIVYLWLGLRTFRLIPSITSLYRRARKRPLKRSYSSKTLGGKIRSFFLQHDVVVQAILIEFQEAQCFFMVACQAAILGAKKFNGLFESTTLRSLWANNGAAGLVSSAGILPVVLGMWSLQKRRMLDPWIFFLSAGTVIVSECALYWTRKPPKPDQLVPIEYDKWPTTCGGHTPPLVWCDNPSFYVYERVPLLFFWYYLNPFCLTVFGLIVIMWFVPYVDKVKFIKQNVLARLRPSQQFFDSKWWSWIRRLPGLLTFLVEIIFTLVLIIDAECFYLFNDLRVIDWNEWSFGQIVAITIWMPVISKYIYWMICKNMTTPDISAPLLTIFN